MKHESTAHSPTVSKAVADVVAAMTAVRSGDSLNIKRTFPGGHMRFACTMVEVAVKPRRKKGARSDATADLETGITIADKYGPAMEITDPAGAARYFEECVEHSMIWFGKSREEAEKLDRINLGYYAGYYDHETRLRVERLFLCVHPVFGPAADGQKSPAEQFALGVEYGKAIREDETMRPGLPPGGGT